MSHGGGAGLMSCVREGSIEPPYRPPAPPPTDTSSHGEGRTGRFLRGLRRMFKRRGSGTRADASPDPKSSSTSELIDSDRHSRRKEGAYGSGLSVSHDSVFTGERSGDESSDERPTPGHGLAHVATSHRAELVAAVRRRGRGDASDDDEDLGLPRSPPASPPTDKADKRHHAGISQSSCSDGSLLSVGSSEMDEDSSSGHHHSQDHSARSDHSDFYSMSEPPPGVAPLSHSAARHKMAVRPRRTHGAPRRNKNIPVAASALPITPELNEEMIRSTTPEVTYRSSEVVTESLSSSTTTKHHVIKQQHYLINKELKKVLETPSDTKLKSSSLPPGLALSQLVGRSPTKLSIAESNTPRSSIKRSQSSTQGQSLKDSSTKKQSSLETQLSGNTEEVARTYWAGVEETYNEKKSKSEKKIENDAIKCSKKEESFFSRWLMRKSGKKAKKDQVDSETQQEVKKSKNEKIAAQYKVVDANKFGFSPDHRQKPIPAERTHKTTGQKVFANEKHKRLDNKGAYVQEGVYKENYSSSKITGIEFLANDLKTAEETDKRLNLDIKNRFSRREENEKIDRVKRTSYKEAIDENKRDSFNLQDKISKSTSGQRILDPFSSKSFINNEVASISKEENMIPSLQISDDEPPLKAVRIKKPYNDYVFHSGSMPKNIPYFNPHITVTDSPSPPKTVLHQSSDNVRQAKRSSEFPEFREKINFDTRREKSCYVTKTEETYATSTLRSLGDEFVETRSSIGKSHSFRYASETTSISSQESSQQMPSLPAIVGISEPILDTWDINYRKSDIHDPSKRLSARNYNVAHGEQEINYDSLPSTDSSYVDSLKNDKPEDRKPFPNTIHITIDNKRNSDISQIEAKIDDIISSPKPIIATTLKSSSLDSVKSSPEKVIEDRRKTISVESALSQSGKISNQKESNHDIESFVSVTHINKEQSSVTIATNDSESKNDEKIQKSTKPGVPEFLFLQLNKVDPKPSTNVVLTANVIPKKLDGPQPEKGQEIQKIVDIAESKQTHSQEIKKVDHEKVIVVNKFTENVPENTSNEYKFSPLASRKSVVQPVAPQSPSASRAYFKKKSSSIEIQDRPEKTRTNSVCTEDNLDKTHDTISIDQKYYSSFGSKSSIQSSDSNDIKTSDRLEEAVVYRKKPLLSRDLRSDRKNDDEPELMKVFARRSLKIKDTEADSIAKDIAEAINTKDETIENVTATKTKILKNEFNASIKSRDSDKENDDTTKEQEDNRVLAVAARVSQFGNFVVPNYQRSISITSVNPKRESAPAFKSEVSKYKKEVSDSTPEKRLRNRTFPDLSNDRDELKNITRDVLYKDTLPKKSWQRSDERYRHSMDKDHRESAVTEKEQDQEQNGETKKKENEEDALQFKCIFERRAEWEKRAQQGMTK